MPSLTPTIFIPKQHLVIGIICTSDHSINLHRCSLISQLRRFFLQLLRIVLIIISLIIAPLTEQKSDINTKDLYLGDEQIITTIVDEIPSYTYTNTGGNILFKINNITYTLTP